MIIKRRCVFRVVGLPYMLSAHGIDMPVSDLGRVYHRSGTRPFGTKGDQVGRGTKGASLDRGQNLT